MSILVFVIKLKAESLTLFIVQNNRRIKTINNELRLLKILL